MPWRDMVPRWVNLLYPRPRPCGGTYSTLGLTTRGDFVNANFDDSRGDIHVGPLDGSTGMLWKARKNAYGLRDAPMQWFVLLHDELQKLGWEPIMQDP